MKFRVNKIIQGKVLTDVMETELTALFDDIFEADGLGEGMFQQFVVTRQPVMGKDGKPTGATSLVAAGVATVYISPKELDRVTAGGERIEVLGVKFNSKEKMADKVIPLKPKEDEAPEGLAPEVVE